MKTTIPALFGPFIVSLGLGLASAPGAAQLPTDLVEIDSPTNAAALNAHGVYMMSRWPGCPPLPPPRLSGASPAGATAPRIIGWLVPTNCTVYYSPSLQALFADDRALAAERLAEQAALGAPSPLPPGPGDGSGSGGGSGDGTNYSSPSYTTNDLWLEMTNVAAGLAYLNLHNATNQVYAIWGATNLPGDWTVEVEVWPTNTAVMPFTVPALAGQSLFVWAEDWTGVTENGNIAPDWWLWEYFGTVALSDTNLDSQGNSLLYDYTNGLDPNTIAFTVSVTNRYVNQSAVPMQIDLLAGVPSYYAVLLNDTNQGDANWQAYPGTNLTVNLGPTDGTYTVSVGLRGLPAIGAQTWQSVTLIRDTTPLTLVLTNPVDLSGSRPFIDPAGYTTRALSALTWTVVAPNGTTNTGSGAVVAQGWNLLDRYHTTNCFQCVDLPLALGLNWISIQAVDWAGTVAATNFAYVFDTNGDTTPPALTLVWPQDGTQVSGDNLTVQAWTDDDTATVALQYTDTNGIVETVNGLVERGGNVWLTVPLAPGTNSFSLVATDAAGNVSTNAFSVVQSSVGLWVSPLSQDQMQYGYATGTGDGERP